MMETLILLLVLFDSRGVVTATSTRREGRLACFLVLGCGSNHMSCPVEFARLLICRFSVYLSASVSCMGRFFAMITPLLGSLVPILGGRFSIMWGNLIY